MRTPTRAIATVTAVPLLALGAAPNAWAANPDRGLYGTTDPTYDGVYRQSLAITGLAAADRPIPRLAVKWLMRQQCPNGSFVSYRSDPTERCPKPDPATYSGPDSNSTAFAAMALRAADERGAAKAAAKYLRKLQNDDGGYAYYRGGTSDANSTSLAVAALRAVRLRGANGARADALRYLRSTQLRCESPRGERGLLSYVAAPKSANMLASAQGAIALVTTFPPTASNAGRATSRLRCTGVRQLGTVGVRDAVLAALASQLKAHDGALPNQFGGGSDLSATAQAVIALGAADRSRAVVKSALSVLRREARTYTGAGTPTANPGALGTLLSLTAVTSAKPNRFGGVKLVRELQATLQGGH